MKLCCLSIREDRETWFLVTYHQLRHLLCAFCGTITTNVTVISESWLGVSVMTIIKRWMLKMEFEQVIFGVPGDLMAKTFNGI